MCGRFIGVPLEVLEQIVQDIQQQQEISQLPDWPAAWPTAYPKTIASVLVPADAAAASSASDASVVAATLPASAASPTSPASAAIQLLPRAMQWGFEVSWSKQVVFNTRFDTALKPGSNMWADSLAQRRCLVPTLGFFEPHQSETFINPRTGKDSKQQYLFKRPGAAILLLAGIYDQEQARFSVMTTAPNRLMQPIHQRMPVVLRPAETAIWLAGNYETLADRSAVELTASPTE